MKRYVKKLLASAMALTVIASAFAVPVSADWVQNSGRWQYQQASGSCIKGRFQRLSGKWYMFDADGYMVTGWYNLPGTSNWYYLQPDGSAVISDWVFDNGWYYIGSDGIMITGWRQIDGVWYYFRESGRMCNNWAKITDSGQTYWYYFNPNGSMKSRQWLRYKDHWYYFDEKGRMLSSSTTYIDQVEYTFDADGRLVEEQETAASKVYDAMTKAVTDRHSGVSSAVANPYELTMGELTDAWGLDTSMVKSFRGETAMMMTNCDMMLVVEAKSGKLSAVKEKLEEALANRIAQFEWYGVMGNSERCAAAKVVTQGNFAALIMVGVYDGSDYDCSGDTAAAVSAFKKAAK